MNLRHAPWGLAEGANLPSVDRFGDRQRVQVVEGLPAKSKEFAGPERVGHVQHQQDAIPRDAASSTALLGGLRVMGSEFTDGPAELNQRAQSTTKNLVQSAACRLRFEWSDSALISSGEVPIASRPILCIYHLIAGSDRSRFSRLSNTSVLPRLKDSKVMGVADENAPEDPQRQESIVGGCAGESFRGVCVCKKGHPGELT